jgi:hypothetical protein
MKRPERYVIIVNIAVLKSRFPLVAFFQAFIRKNNPHIRVLAGFLKFYVLK